SNLITLLSPKRFENTFLSDSEIILNQKKKGLEVLTIHSYKGLENVVIVLYDFPEINSEESKRLMYVGISRATQQLNIILKQDLEQSYQKLISSNLSKLS
ncbi:MAG: 3'-5' exonuclease, partial [Candidatus Paceibacterota bacterium]